MKTELQPYDHEAIKMLARAIKKQHEDEKKQDREKRENEKSA